MVHRLWTQGKDLGGRFSQHARGAGCWHLGRDPGRRGPRDSLETAPYQIHSDSLLPSFLQRVSCTEDLQRPQCMDSGQAERTEGERDNKLFHMRYVRSKRIGVTIVHCCSKVSSSKETGA